MNDFTQKLAKKIIEGDGYAEASASLFFSYVDNLTGEKSTPSRNQIKKLISSAQIFQKSKNTKFANEGSIILSMLLDICAEEHRDLLVIANDMFVNQGDFPNVNLLERRFDEISFDQDFIYQAQLNFRESLNTVKGLDFALTDFQRSLWNTISSDEDVITVAPTSAGKTHIILSYLVNKLSVSDGAFAAVVVPTRALISEVATNIYQMLKAKNLQDNIEICTLPRDKQFSEKTFFVVTQERLYEILQKGDIYFDYLFLDEAHNISDQSRGVLLHLTIEKMLEDSNPQVIISMPSSNYQNAFTSIFKGVSFQKEITDHSPVAKILISVVPKGRELIISRYNSMSYKKIKKNFLNRRLSDIVFRLGKGQSNIIYRNQTDHCESVADELAELVGEIDVDELLEQAADYVENFVHSEFSLASNLRRGVAFHYGPLPSSIRVMIENLAKEDRLKYIACTSTLAEGVNLPAKNLFLKNPLQRVMHKPSERIEDVKINNITGRAGRMLQHFSGNIFLVEPEEWTFKDYFEEKDNHEEKIPSFYKAINEELSSIVSALRGDYDNEDGQQYRVYTIANKLVKEFSNGMLANALLADELTISQEDINKLKDAVKFAYEELKVAPFTLEASPTVGYIQQNKLFDFLSRQPSLDDWLLPHPKSGELYPMLVKVVERLNEFGIYIPSDAYSIKHVCLIARKWIQGFSLKEIISEQIEWDRKESDRNNVNGSVRGVIKVINNDIRFRLSNALRCYDVLLTNVLIDQGKDISTSKLYAFLEIGACDERMVALINMGLSREAAKEIDSNLATDVRVDSVNNLLNLYRENRLDAIHIITKKELVRLFSAG